MQRASVAAWLVAGTLAAQEPTRPSPAVRFGLRELHTIGFDGEALPEVTVHAHGSSLGRLCFPRDGKRLFVGMQAGRDGATFAVDVATGAVTRLATAGTCVGALQHGPLVFTGAALVAPEDPGREPVAVPDRSDAFASPFGDVAVVTFAGRFGLVTHRLDLATGAKVGLRLYGCFAAGVAWAADGKMAIARGQAAAGGRVAIESIRVFDAAGKQVADVKVTGSDAKVLAFTHDGNGLVFVDDRLRIVDVTTGVPRAVLAERPACWQPLGAAGVLSHDGERVVLRDAASLAVVKEFPLGLPDPEVVDGKARSPRLLQTATSPDGRLLAVAGPTMLKLFRILGGE
ncbi:MAG: hypothetical protein FJ265_03840 [Planctomycetes bacterium]|nr:hypothetical protein [Planctomycetota bacterium]